MDHREAEPPVRGHTAGQSQSLGPDPGSPTPEPVLLSLLPRRTFRPHLVDAFRLKS